MPKGRDEINRLSAKTGVIIEEGKQQKRNKPRQRLLPGDLTCLQRGAETTL